MSDLTLLRSALAIATKGNRDGRALTFQDTFFTGHVQQSGLFGDEPDTSSPRTWTVVPERLRQTTPRRPVVGTYSATRRCDDRCTSARGNLCVCQCGGINHGRDWT